MTDRSLSKKAESSLQGVDSSGRGVEFPSEVRCLYIHVGLDVPDRVSESQVNFKISP